MRLVFFFFLFIIHTVATTQSSNLSKLDSVIYYRQLSKNADLTFQDRLQLAKKASDLSSQLNIDTTTVLDNRNLSFLYLMLGDYEPYKEVNTINLKLATQLKDSLVLAIANNNLAWYHHYNQQNDSAYYYYNKALHWYEQLNSLKNQASILGNIASIQRIEKDYVGSEENIIRALKLLQKLPSTEANLDNQWIMYNRLGIISLDLKQYDKSLEYHDKALEVSDKMKDGYYNEKTSIHNKASVYRKTKKFDEAIALYESLLEEEVLFEMDPIYYPLIIDNLAFTKFEAGHKDYDNIERELKRAYRLGDSLQDQVIKLGVTIDLAKFYKGLNQVDSAAHYAQKSYELSKSISDNDILLESMSILAQLKQGDEAKMYFYEHVKLSDSLLFKERSARNKFARIAFETEEMERENERISRERLWLLMLSVGLLLTLVLLYIIISQRAKNKELKFRQDQQQANEEIYNLMLSQQDKVEEARTNEKRRISQELHDGILGRLFGTRLSLDSFNFSEGPEAIKTRSNYISELKIIEEDIRKISHDLNTDFVSRSGFMDILEELIEKQTQAYQLKYTFNSDDSIVWETVPNKTKINIYRIVQEALQNIYKHAEAKIVQISFKLKKDVICLSIKDDGKGFDVNKSKKGIGLKNINSRVKDFDGNVNFESQINEGTIITIKIPYQPN
ncbi:signal transduction histidine kinase [Flavobacteriaceae bacterium MAR_2010_105]|nr:signal transduction histidine kinase [Flavobacteriaceae bacterium MAR_2010_105]